MQKRIVKGMAIASVAVGFTAWVSLEQAWAQTPPNQSDNSGTTVVEPSIETREGDESFLDQDVLEAAERISRDLGQARIACADSKVAAVNLPRRFARGPVTNEVCVSQECLTLRVVTQQAREFLQSLDDAQRDRLRQVQALQLW
jgi:hypothetical protein